MPSILLLASSSARPSVRIVTSLVKDMSMPPISLLTGGLDFSNKFIVLRKAGTARSHSILRLTHWLKAGAITWNYGNFITLVINFSIVAGASSLL